MMSSSRARAPERRVASVKRHLRRSFFRSAPASGPCWRAGCDVDNLAGAVDVERLREVIDAAIGLGDLLIRQENRVADAELLRGGRDVVALGAVVLGEAQDLETLVLILRGELLEPWHLQLAGAAPGGPEVDHDRMAFEVGERNLLAGKV